MKSKTLIRNEQIRADLDAELARGYDPSKPWSEYKLKQAAWRVSIGTGTQADKDALRHAQAQ